MPPSRNGKKKTTAKKLAPVPRGKPNQVHPSRRRGGHGGAGNDPIPTARDLMERSDGFTESGVDKKARALAIDAALREMYPDAHCELDFNNAFELLIATILAAQCTDVTVNKVTKVLFDHYPDAAALADADVATVETLVKSTGFFRNKAKNIVACARAIVEQHGGEVPNTMDALTALPGVARKTANVVLGNVFGINEGFVVDTHVTRLSNLLKLTAHEDAKKIERDLVELFPRKDWAMVSHRLIFHGRYLCIAKAPDCARCGIRDLCPSAETVA